jgi:hypothetical protein
MPNEKSASTKTTADPETSKPPPEDPLSPYLSYGREGNPDAPTPEGQFFVASLSQGGHTTSLYAKSREEIEARAREILASRGIEV